MPPAATAAGVADDGVSAGLVLLRSRERLLSECWAFKDGPRGGLELRGCTHVRYEYDAKYRRPKADGGNGRWGRRTGATEHL